MKHQRISAYSPAEDAAGRRKVVWHIVLACLGLNAVMSLIPLYTWLFADLDVFALYRDPNGVAGQHFATGWMSNAGIGSSIVLDVHQGFVINWPESVTEEMLKLLGITFWCAYCLRTASQLVLRQVGTVAP